MHKCINTRCSFHWSFDSCVCKSCRHHPQDSNLHVNLSEFWIEDLLLKKRWTTSINHPSTPDGDDDFRRRLRCRGSLLKEYKLLLQSSRHDSDCVASRTCTTWLGFLMFLELKVIISLVIFHTDIFLSSLLNSRRLRDLNHLMLQ